MVLIKPTQQHLESGVEYCFDPDGSVQRRPGVMCWHFKCTSGFFRRDCALTDPEGKLVLSIRRTSFWPATFQMIEEGKPVGTIRRLSLLRTRYEVALCDGTTWNVRVPLYRMHFHAISNSGGQIFIALAPILRWYALTEPRSNEPRILMAIAFIYREWGAG